MRAVKKSKAKKNSTAITTEEKEEQKAVVVIPSTEEGEEAVLTKDENFIEKKPAGKRRLWGALAGALKGVFVVIMVCAPLSGLSSVINSASPETQKLLKDVINGDAKVQVADHLMIQSKCFCLLKNMKIVRLVNLQMVQDSSLVNLLVNKCLMVCLKWKLKIRRFI